MTELGMSTAVVAATYCAAQVSENRFARLCWMVSMAAAAVSLAIDVVITGADLLGRLHP